MARRPFSRLPIWVPAALLIGAALSPASAQVVAPHRHRTIWAHRVVATTDAPVTYRGLTINRPPERAPAPEIDDQDVYQDGPTHYNDVRDFSPAPYTTSGVQYPYGLDGIGGFGSDLGFGAGQDTALYNRGAGAAP